MNDSFDMAVGPLKNDIEELIQKIRCTHDGRKTFFSTDAFPWVTQVEAHWQAIRNEVDSLLMALDLLPGFEEIQTEQYQLSQDKRWKIFPIFAYGYWLKRNMERCPETTKAIKMIPDLRAAMFSILQPQKELPSHMGNYCGVLRYQLAIKVPKQERLCGISVGGQEVHWQEGKSLIFDDTHMHHAWNRSGEDRVVLFVDFNRPLPIPLNEMNNRVIANIGQSHFIDNAIQQWDAWELAHGDKLDEWLGRRSESTIAAIRD